jgi:hypothetical protein
MRASLNAVGWDLPNQAINTFSRLPIGTPVFSPGENYTPYLPMGRLNLRNYCLDQMIFTIEEKRYS